VPIPTLYNNYNKCYNDILYLNLYLFLNFILFLECLFNKKKFMKMKTKFWASGGCLGGEPRGDWSPLGEIKVFIGGFLSKNERTALKERH